MRKKTILGLALLAGLVFAASCAAEPTEEIRAADEAFQKASAAEVEEYAPDSLAAAREAKSQLDAELAQQREHFTLLRSYKKVSELAAASKTASEKAVEDALTARDVAMNQASAEISAARASLGEARDLLAVAPAGKGTQAAYEVIRKHIAHLDADRPLFGDINRLKEVVASGEILDAVEAAVGPLA